MYLLNLTFRFRVQVGGEFALSIKSSASAPRFMAGIVVPANEI